MTTYIFLLFNDYTETYHTVFSYTLESAQELADTYATEHGYYTAKYLYWESMVIH
jgi:hypothetical protein